MKVYKLVATALLAGLAIFFQFYNGVLGVQTGFGMTVDLAALPILIALFVLGFDAAFEALIILTLAIAVIAETGYVGAITKFAATLPMILLPALYVIAFKKKIDAARVAALVLLSSIALVFVFALLSYPSIFAFASLKGMPLGAAGVYLFGLIPVALMALVSFALYRFLASEAGAEALLKLASVTHALVVLCLALLVRGIAMVVANVFFAGPLFFKLTPQEFISYLESLNLPLFGKGSAWFAVIFFWNCVQGALEFGLAWLIAFKFAFAKRYGLRGAPTAA